MKKLNIPLILILGIGSLIVVPGIYFLHRYQVSRSAEKLLVRAEKAEQADDTDEQIRLLRRYLRHRPDDLENLKKLLETSRDHLFTSNEVDRRSLGGLLESLEKAIRDNPEDADLRRQGYIFSTGIGRYGDALDHLAQLKKMGELTAEDRIVMAQCLWRNGDSDEAISELCKMTGFDILTETFDDETATAPEQVDAFALLAVIYAREISIDNDLTIPTMIVNKAVEQNPESVDAYLRRASFLQENIEGRKGKEASLADIKKALELAGDDARIVLAASTTALSLGDVTWAAQLADEGIAAHPKSAALYAKRAEIARADGKTDEALEFINRGLEENVMNRELLYRRGGYEIDLNRLDEARTTIQRLGTQFDPLRAEILRARVLMAENDVRAAARSLERLRSSVAPGSRSLSLVTEYLANCYRRLNQHDRIQSLGLNMKNPQARFNQAEAYARQGMRAEAIRIYGELLKDDEDLRPEGRELIFNRLLALRIQAERAKPLPQRDWSRVDRMAQVLVGKLDLSDDALAQFEIEILMNKELNKEARVKAERAVSRFPRNPGFRLLLAQLTNDSDQARRILGQLEQTLGDSVTLRLAKADQILKARAPDMAERLVALEENSTSFSDEARSKLWRGLAGAYRRVGLPKDAIRMWRELLKSDERNTGIRVVVFDLAFEANDPAEMERALAEIAEYAGKDSSEWQVAQARHQLLLVGKGESPDVTLDDITELLERARASRPEFAPTYMVQAEVHVMKREGDKAVEAIRTALEKRPGEVAYLQRLADVLVSMNRLDEARPILAQLPERQKRVTDVISEIRMLVSEDPDEALKRAKKIFPPDSDNADVLMNLIEVYQIAKRLGETIPILERAIKLAPERARLRLIYVRALTEMGRDDEAKAAIEGIKSAIPTEQQPLLLGQAYTMVNEFDKAEQSYASGLKTDPTNTVLLRNQALLLQATKQTEKLRACLEQLVAVDANSNRRDQVDVAWGRRMLAREIASSGTYQDFLAALDLLEQNAAGSDQLAGQDLATWLQLCASRPEASSRTRAVDRLNEIRNDRSLTSHENFVLAYIYQTEGRWSEARRLMIGVLAKNPDSVEFKSQFIQWLLEREDFSDAAAWIRKLDPRSIETIRFSSILLAQQGKSQEAAKRLLSLVPKQMTQITATRIIEELGEYDPRFFKLAHRQWKSIVSKKPQMVPAYIEFLARMPDGAGLDEALQLAEKQLKSAAKDQRPDLAAYYLDQGVKALRTNRRSLDANSPQYQRVHGWFGLARQAQVEDLVLAWQEVNFFDTRRDYEKLSTLYQDLIGRSDLSDLQRAVVRNNLAFIYAISNRGEEALAVIGDAISLLGPRSDFLDTRGLAYLANGQLEDAVKDLRSAVAGGQGDAATYFHLALAEYSSGNVAEAMAAIVQANDMGLDEADLSSPEVSLYRQLMDDLKPHLKENELSQAR